MTREEIRDGLIDILDGLETPYTDEDNRPRGYVDAVLEYLHSQGVVIKVKRELPKECQDCAIYQSYSGGAGKLLKAGCGFFEPLIGGK